MKLQKATPALLALLLFLSSVIFITTNDSKKVTALVADEKELVMPDSLATHEKKNHEANSQRQSVSLLDHNFLFNLIYEFAYGELIK